MSEPKTTDVTCRAGAEADESRSDQPGAPIAPDADLQSADQLARPRQSVDRAGAAGNKTTIWERDACPYCGYPLDWHTGAEARRCKERDNRLARMPPPMADPFEYLQNG